MTRTSSLTLGLPERFWAKTRIEDRGHATPCVVWTGATTVYGYGLFGVPTGSGLSRLVHRRAYEALVGPIADGLVVDHLCRVTICVAADHLEAVTQRENVLRSDSPAGRQARQTECKNGHPFDEANTRTTHGSKRRCRTCERTYGRERRLRNKQQMEGSR